MTMGKEPVFILKKDPFICYDVYNMQQALFLTGRGIKNNRGT